MLDMGFGQKLDPKLADLITRAAAMFARVGAVVEPLPRAVQEDPMPALNLFLQSRARHELGSLPKAARKRALPHVIEWSSCVEGFSALELSRALFQLEDFKAGVTEVFTPFDFILSPALTAVRFPAEAVGPLETDHFAHCSFAIPFNQVGMPALSVCAGMLQGMPVGLQIAARRYDDLGALRLGRLFEELRGAIIDWSQTPCLEPA